MTFFWKMSPDQTRNLPLIVPAWVKWHYCCFLKLAIPILNQHFGHGLAKWCKRSNILFKSLLLLDYDVYKERKYHNWSLSPLTSFLKYQNYSYQTKPDLFPSIVPARVQWHYCCFLKPRLPPSSFWHYYSVLCTLLQWDYRLTVSAAQNWLYWDPPVLHWAQYSSGIVHTSSAWWNCSASPGIAYSSLCLIFRIFVQKPF